MEINNTLLEKKHHYMLIMRETEILKRQMEYEVLTEEIPKIRLDEVYRIFNMTFIGLLREGLAYQYIKNANNAEKDIIRITIDNVNYECKVKVLKNILGKEYYEIMKINPEDKSIFNNNEKEEKTKDIDIKIPDVVTESEIGNTDENDIAISNVEKEAVILPVPDEEEDEYVYVEEKQKKKNTMLYDKWKLHILEQGAVKGLNIDLIVYPLMITKNKLISDIVVWARCGQEVKTFVSNIDGRKSVEVNIGEHSLLVRGCFKNGNFESTIVPAGITLALNASINKSKEEIRPTNMNSLYDGHVTYMSGETKVHVFPITNENDADGSAQVIVCSEKDDERRLYDTYNQKIILIDGQNGNEQILSYWEDDTLISDNIEK